MLTFVRAIPLTCFRAIMMMTCFTAAMVIPIPDVVLAVMLTFFTAINLTSNLAMVLACYKSIMQTF